MLIFRGGAVRSARSCYQHAIALARSSGERTSYQRRLDRLDVS